MMADNFKLALAIPEPNYSKFIKRLEHLNKRAGKIGTEPVVLDITEIEDRIMNENTGEVVKFFHVTLEGEVPVIDGWILAAVIDHQYDDGNMIRHVPTPESLDIEIDTKWRSAPSDCDHCGHQRVRNETFLLWKEGEWKQVGRTCLKDFGANEFLVNRLQWLEYIYELAESASEYFFDDSPHLINRMDTITYLRHVAAVVGEVGWMSRGKASELGIAATADLAFGNIWKMKDGEEHIRPTEEHATLAKRALEWAQTELNNIDPMSDYEWNLSLACDGATMRYKDSGLVASLIPTFQRAVGEWVIEEKEDRPPSEFVGEVGKRDEFELTVEAMIPFDTEYGLSHLHLMVDPDGNIFKWFTTAQPVKREVYCEFLGLDPNAVDMLDKFNMEVGASYRIRGTIKEHETFNGIKQTGLTRCSVLAVLDLPKTEPELEANRND